MGAHDGHRKRIIQKIESNALLPHEFLEILLFNGVPRRNTNDLAHRLLAEFGSIPGVFAASMEQLQRVDGVGESLAAYIRVIGLCYTQYSQVAKESPYPKTFNRDSFLPFVKKEYCNLTREVLDVYLLGEDGLIVARKRFSEERFFDVELPPEELTKLFMEYSPSGIVLVHNHPFGEATPSKTDDRMTQQCQLICSTQNVLLCDHIIYAPNGLHSYYLSGEMQRISQRYSLDSVLEGKNLPSQQDEWDR